MTSKTIRRWRPAELVAVGLVLAMAGPAGGQSKGPPARPPRLDATAVTADLARPETVAAALAAIQAAGPSAKKLAPQVEALLARGLPPHLAAAAIGALGAVGARSPSAVIAPYMSHRDASVREAAAKALGNTGGPQAAAALAAGLRSYDPAVRAASAKALRSAGDRDDVPDLLRALDRGELDAAASIAALCAPDQCRELLDRWTLIARPGSTEPGPQEDVLDAMLARKPPLPDDVLLLAVARLGASGSPSARPYLQTAKKKRGLSAKVRKAIEAAARGPERAP